MADFICIQGGCFAKSDIKWFYTNKYYYDDYTIDIAFFSSSDFVFKSIFKDESTRNEAFEDLKKQFVGD